MAGRLHIAPIDLPRLLPELVINEPLLSGANLAPRQGLSMIRLDAGRAHLRRAFWGLTPPWLKVLDHAPHCARAESLDERKMFAEAFAARRCLIPVSGIYVWRAMPRGKQPYLVTRADRGPLLLAGLWARYHTTLSAFHDSMALITVAAPSLLTPLTDRLPAVIDADQAAAWLDPTTSLDKARAMLKPASRELLGAFPVSRRVNNPLNQEWACGHPTGPMLRSQPEQES